MDLVAEQSRASIQKDDLKILLPIVAKIEPENILEIGMHQGYSIETWVRAFSCRVIGIEKDSPTPISYTSPFSPLWNTDSHNLDTLQKVKDLTHGELIDFLFIDGDHSLEGVQQDFEMYSPLVREGGIIVLHDVVYTSPDPLSPVMVRPFWEILKKQYPYLEIRTKGSTGMGVLWNTSMA